MYRSMCRFRLASVLRLLVIYSTRPRAPYASSDTIHWELLTKPAVFGNAIMLDCRLPENTCCSRYTRRWLGGHGLGLLVMDGVSAIPKKYSEVFNAETRSSKLTIHALNPNDVNIPYECTYGFKTYTKELTLSMEYFESYPTKPFVINVTTEPGNILSVYIKLQPVYPEPNCSATFDGADISDFMNISTVMHELFYVVVIILQYTMVSPDCTGLFILVCNIGTQSLEIQQNVTCNDDSSNNETCSDWDGNSISVPELEILQSTLAISLVLAGMTVFALIIAWILYRRKKNHSLGIRKQDHELKTMNPASCTIINSSSSYTWFNGKAGHQRRRYRYN